MAAAIFSFLMLLAALIALGLAAYAWQQRHTREGMFFTGLMMTVAVYTFTAAAGNVADTDSADMFWRKLNYVGIVLTGPFWWMFVLQALGRIRDWPPTRLALPFGIPLVGVALAWTNEWHWLTWTHVIRVNDALGARLAYIPGPAVWVVAAYGYALFVYAFVLLLQAVLQAHGARRRVWGAMLVGSFFPFAFNVIFLAGLNPWPGIDLTPLGMTLAGVVVILGQLRTPLFDTLPVAEHALFDSISDVVVVVDCTDHVLGLNPSARSTLGLEDSRLGRPLSELHPGLAALLARARPFSSGQHESIEWEFGAGEHRRIFDVRISPLRAAGELQPDARIYGRVLTGRDVTRERLALAAADRRARQMELISAMTQDGLDTPSLFALLQSLVDHLVELLEADGALITEWDDDRKIASVAVAAGALTPALSTPATGPDEATITQAVLASGRPLALSDLAEQTQLSARISALFPGYACLALPLIAGRVKLGAAIIGYCRPPAFDAEQMALAEQAARVTALVISKARLFEAERWRLAELTALQSISAVVAGSLDLQEVFDTAVRLLHETFGYSLIGVYRMEGDSLHLRAQRGYKESRVYRRIDLGQGVIGRAVRTRTLQFVRDISADTDYRSAGEQVDSEICVPLLKDDRVLGAINIENPAQRPFTEQDVRLMQAFATQLAVAIDNAELYEAERTQRELAEAQREVGLALSQALELDDLLDRILESVRRVAPYDAASVLMVDDAGRSAVVARRTGFYQFGPDVDAEIRGMTFDLATTANLRRMLESGQPMVVPVPAEDPDWIPLKAAQFLHSWAGAPVILDGKAAAFINVEHCQPGFYHAGYLPPLAAIAAQVGVAVRNARLFREVREQVQREQRLFAATRDFTNRLGEDAVMEAITRHMTEALLTDGCTISRWVPELDQVVTVRDFVRHSNLRVENPGTAYPLAEYPATRRVIESRELVFLSAADPQTDPAERAVMEKFGAGMALILPLVAGREAPVYGVVEVYRVPGRCEFSEKELDLARNLTAQAAQAIENARLFAEVQRLAVMDELTGLYNRRGFFELGRREHERAVRYQHSLTAVFLDIDHFKLFNDAFSYAVGDQALRLVANCLRETTRESDLIGRYGGEEFVVLLPETDLKAGLRVAERIRKAVGEMRVKTGWGDVNLTVSIGVRQRNDETPTLDHLVDAAGQALHVAKEQGRNRVSTG